MSADPFNACAPRRGITVAVLSGLITFLISACASPAYLWQATQGHLHLMSQRQELDSILTDPNTPNALRAELEQIQTLLEFAESELDLPAGDSFASVVLTKGPVTWNVVAAPEFSLQALRWCFPVAGCVPYRGYFDLTDAEAFAARLESRGHDVRVSAVSAYSTLGWFDDPLIAREGKLGDARFWGTIIHELAHQRFYIRGESHFNESYAQFMEQTGLEAWLSRGDDVKSLRAWRAARSNQQRFNARLRETRSTLEALYSSGVGADAMRRQKQAELEDLAGATLATGSSDSFNNADLALLSLYRGGLCAFRQLYEDVGGSAHAFHERIDGLTRLNRGERERWLSGQCTDIASDREL